MEDQFPLHPSGFGIPCGPQGSMRNVGFRGMEAVENIRNSIRHTPGTIFLHPSDIPSCIHEDVKKNGTAR